MALGYTFLGLGVGLGVGVLIHRRDIGSFDVGDFRYLDMNSTNENVEKFRCVGSTRFLVWV